MKCAIAAVLAGVLAVALGASLKIEDETLVSPRIVGDDVEVSPYIVGGDRVQYLERPYTVRLQLLRNWLPFRYCGGARLNQNWFITAAECLDQPPNSALQIMYPASDAEHNHRMSYRHFNNLRYSIHPQYNNITKANNIGLFFFPFVNVPDSLPNLPSPRNSTESEIIPDAVVSGWSHTAQFPNEIITSYNTTIVNSFLCEIAYFFRVTSRHICASSSGGNGITETDVGVPLVLREGSEQTLVGIASSIRPWTTILPLPTVFTRIEPYVEWITQQTAFRNLHD